MSDKIWCQNPKCPNKQTNTQIRGIKGHKYYMDTFSIKKGMFENSIFLVKMVKLPKKKQNL